MKKKHTTIALLVFALFFTTGMHRQAYTQPPDPAAAEIFETVRQAYEQSIRGINDYVVVTENFTTHYVKKYDENNRPYFEPKVETASFLGSISALGLHSASPMADNDFFSSEVYDRILQNARYIGTERINGFETHVVYLGDMDVFVEALDDLDETPGNMTMFFDAQNWVLRKMKFSIVAEVEEGRSQEISPEIHFLDYRDVEGMMIPFNTQITIDGLMAGLSEAEREQAKQGLVELERELENMPADQRQMIEQMMGDQLETLRKMVEGDRLEFSLRVKEVLVNTQE